jgi:hypothetical protein
VGQLGANAHGEVLEVGRVPDCYLGLLLDPGRRRRGGRLLAHIRRLTLRLPATWPWATALATAFARLRTLLPAPGRPPLMKSRG